MYSAQASERQIVYLHESEYKGYFEIARIGIIYLDRLFRVKVINDEAENLCGVERSQVRGKLAEYVFDHLGESFMRIITATPRGEVCSSIIKIHVHGHSLFLQAATMQICDDNDVFMGMIIMLQDASSVKAAIKQIQTTRLLMSLGELAAGVAHHVRTPLTTISGYLQVMISRLEENQYTVKRDVIETMLEEVSYINHVVTELIMFAKPAVKKEANVNLNSVINEAMLLTFKQLGGEKIIIDKMLTNSLPTITADPNLLKQAFVNVLQNAVEAMDDEGILSVRTWKHCELNMLVVSITDTGGGVSNDILPRVFEPFYTTKLDRIGLGLPTAHRIISEHGGLIHLKSAKDMKLNAFFGGTQVLIYLPIVDATFQNRPLFHQQILNLQ